jgi:hypothetical protein
MENQPPSPKTVARKQRLAQALRQNLKKRKAQEKSRETEPARQPNVHRKPD